MRACPDWGGGRGRRCYSPPCENMSPASRDRDTKPFPSPDTVCPWSLRVRRKLKTYLVNPSHCAREKLQDKPLAPHECRSRGVSASKPKLSLSALSFLPPPSPHEAELHGLAPLAGSTSPDAPWELACRIPKRRDRCSGWDKGTYGITRAT